MVINVHAWNCLGRYYVSVSLVEDDGDGATRVRTFVNPSGPYWPDEDSVALFDLGSGIQQLAWSLMTGKEPEAEGWRG
jgi:hypothetical protein